MSNLLSIPNLLSFSLAVFRQPKYFRSISSIADSRTKIDAFTYFNYCEKLFFRRYCYKRHRIRDKKVSKDDRDPSKLRNINIEQNVSISNTKSLNKSTPLIVEMIVRDDKKTVNSIKNLKENATDKIYSLDEMKTSLQEIKWDFDALQHRQKLIIGATDKKPLLMNETIDKKEVNDSDYLEDIMLDEVKHKPVKKRQQKHSHSIKGSPDPNFPMTDIPCSGCGALIHCHDTAVSGYMPSEKLKSLTRDELRISTCQRCFLIQHHNMCLNVKIHEDELPKIFLKIKHEKALVLVVIDLFDMKNSMLKDLSKHIGKNRPLYIIGNKVDMIPKDESGYLERIKSSLVRECYDSGLLQSEKNCKHVCLVSAKTGYGIEVLVTKLMMDWQLKGNIYVVGNTNSGKSTLFNALLQSDYCKANVRDAISRATVSVWPGTTLSLLKFPVVNPTPWRLYKRKQRLFKERSAQVEEEMLRKQRLKNEGRSKNATLLGYVSLTDFRKEDNVQEEHETADISCGSDITSYELQKDGQIDTKYGKRHIGEESGKNVLKENMFEMSKWFFDTPGVINKNQIINNLSQQELFKVLPKGLIKPCPFVLSPGQVMFISGLGRLDYVQGQKSIVVTVHTSDLIPVHVLNADQADDFYNKHIGTDTLGVPLGDEERLNSVPSLVGHEYQLTGIDMWTVSADIQLSSLGWLSFCIPKGLEVCVRAFVPGGYGCYIRRSALLPRAKNFRGPRIRGTPMYKLVKPVA